MYQNDPMRYAVVCVDCTSATLMGCAVRFADTLSIARLYDTVRGVDVLRLIRNFESLNNIPPCFLICTDSSRNLDLGRHVTKEMVMASGVDITLPCFYYMLPLYDALAGIVERSEWHGRHECMTKVDPRKATVTLED